MRELEQILTLFVAAVALSALARRVGAPYPVFLALGGATLAFIPGTPTLTVPPELALALFVAPVLLDAAYDASLRDLRDNWLPVASLVLVAVALTTLAVAVVVRLFVPAMPWAAAIALGAIVAPPDAVAATAVLRQLRPPQRIMTILEGESLLNDASSLLIYRLAVSAAVAGAFSIGDLGPAFLLGVGGSLLAGPAFAWITLRLSERIEHVPTAIIVQFVATFAVWIVAERIRLSPVLTTVTFAMTLARTAPQRIPARNRLPTNAVWETVVFALNIIAFIFIGLQLRPIYESLATRERLHAFAIAATVVATVVVVRIAWHMSFNAGVGWSERHLGFRPRRSMMRATFGTGLLISWAGMRGIVTLAAALALPAQFPFRNLIVLTAFSVVLGTLVIQGLTLKPLMRLLRLRDDDPVGRELREARVHAAEAALRAVAELRSPAAEAVRDDLQAWRARSRLALDGADVRTAEAIAIRRRALGAARDTIIGMRNGDVIGDDAFHRIEQELDWLEMAVNEVGR